MADAKFLPPRRRQRSLATSLQADAAKTLPDEEEQQEPDWRDSQPDYLRRKIKDLEEKELAAAKRKVLHRRVMNRAIEAEEKADARARELAKEQAQQESDDENPQSPEGEASKLQEEIATGQERIKVVEQEERVAVEKLTGAAGRWRFDMRIQIEQRKDIAAKEKILQDLQAKQANEKLNDIPNIPAVNRFGMRVTTLEGCKAVSGVFEDGQCIMPGMQEGCRTPEECKAAKALEDAEQDMQETSLEVGKVEDRCQTAKDKLKALQGELDSTKGDVKASKELEAKKAQAEESVNQCTKHIDELHATLKKLRLVASDRAREAEEIEKKELALLTAKTDKEAEEVATAKKQLTSAELEKSQLFQDEARTLRERRRALEHEISQLTDLDERQVKQELLGTLRKEEDDAIKAAECARNGDGMCERGEEVELRQDAQHVEDQSVRIDAQHNAASARPNAASQEATEAKEHGDDHAESDKAEVLEKQQQQAEITALDHQKVKLDHQKKATVSSRLLESYRKKHEEYDRLAAEPTTSLAPVLLALAEPMPMLCHAARLGSFL